jgi:hypothetical protein
MALHTIRFLNIHLKGYSLALNRTKPVSAFRTKKGERVALQKYLKNIGDCMRSHNGSNGIPLSTSVFCGFIIPLTSAFANKLKKNILCN